MSDKRIAALEKMVERSPQEPRFRFGLALEYLKADRLDDGIRELRSYLDASDDEGNAWGRLGAALRAAGRDDEAKEAYRLGIEAADRHGHPTMVEEFEAELESW